MLPPCPWLLQGDGKMSKSKGNVIYADDLVEFFGVDAVRYFVLINMLDQPVCILTHLKKVCFLPGRLYFPEHGQKIELKAQEKGITPKEFVDGVAETIKGLWDLMDTSLPAAG